MMLPEMGPRTILKRKRTKTGYTAVRVTYATRDLLQRIESQFDESLDSIIFYMAAKELGMNYAAILSAIESCQKRLGCARAAR